MEKVWREKLIEEIQKPYMQSLSSFLEQERQAGKVVYPPREDIFSAFSHTPYNEVKVVIVGQDPYHGPDQAHGLSFSVRRGITPPPSLVNIYKELNSDLGIPIPDHGCLLSWSKQGVLLLNATLTVLEKEPKSHYGKGWERFTDFVVELLANREDPIVFMLWGRSAKEKCEKMAVHKNHLVLTAMHPSPLSAYNGFFGCKHFSQANAFLQKMGKKPIDWNVD